MKFDSYHPMINLIYFVAAIGMTIAFDHPAFVIIAYLCAFAYSVKLNGIKALIFNICLIPCGVGYSLWYAYYNHFGVTNLRQNIVGNQITLESLVYGLQLGITAITVIMFLSCMFAVFTSDKVVYLFGKISPKLSLFLSILLRTVPRVKKYASKINTAQKGIGMAPSQGHILRKVINSFRLVSILITWTLENFVESSTSMKCRGYSLKGRTAFSIYRFDNRDRLFVITIFLMFTAIAMAWAFNQTNIYYDPQIIVNPITALSFVFYFAYACVLLLPMILQIAGEAKFKKLVASSEDWKESMTEVMPESIAMSVQKRVKA